MSPKKHHALHLMQISGKIDLLDSYLTPTRGILLEGSYELSDTEFLGSSVNYSRLESSADYYRPIGNRHHVHLQFTFLHALHNLPLQKYFYSGGPTTFLGLQYDQLVAKSFTYLRSDYSYQIKKDLFAKIIGDYTFDYQHLAWQAQTKTRMYGYGFALQYNTFIGPANLTIANGPESTIQEAARQTVVYFTLGYRF